MKNKTPSAAQNGFATTPVTTEPCASCEGYGRIECLPDDGTHTMPCDSCQPELQVEFQKGYESALYCFTKAIEDESYESETDENITSIIQKLKAGRQPLDDGAWNTFAEFGKGRMVVSSGTYGGKPAVFIQENGKCGEVGSNVKPEDRLPSDKLSPPAIVIMFPTDAQAEKVGDALVQPKDAPDPSEVVRLREEKEALKDALIEAMEILNRTVFKKDVLKLQEENKRLREALGLYADEAQWHRGEHSPWKLSFNSEHYDDDGYSVAKKALAAAKAGE